MFFKRDGAQDYKTQYMRLILKHHPDKGGDSETFRAIQSEYKSILFLFGQSPNMSKSWADQMDEDAIDLEIKTVTNDTLYESRKEN